MELKESRVFTLSLTHEEAKLIKEYLYDVHHGDKSVPAVEQAAIILRNLLTGVNV